MEVRQSLKGSKGIPIMPIHDWTRVNAGLLHHFHQRWISALSDALNAESLPVGYFALAEQTVGGLIPDVITLQQQSRFSKDATEPSARSALAVAEAPLRAWTIRQAEEDAYASRADRIAIHHPLGEVVVIVEIVSPGNKSSRSALRSFAEKAVDLLRRGIHLLVVDLFPPGDRAPQGIHPIIWDEFIEEPFELPSGKLLTIASYSAGPVKTAYAEPVSIGDPLPGIPLFLTASSYILTPLEGSYQATWAVCPAPLREAVTHAHP